MRLDGSLPTGWSVITRDLYADFGEFTLTGLARAGRRRLRRPTISTVAHPRDLDLTAE